MELARPIRPAQHRPLDAQHVETGFPGQAALKNRQHLRACFLAQGRVPQEARPRSFQRAMQVGRLGIQE